jgi:hypothetical protein
MQCRWPGAHRCGRSRRSALMARRMPKMTRSYRLGRSACGSLDHGCSSLPAAVRGLPRGHAAKRQLSFIRGVGANKSCHCHSQVRAVGIPAVSSLEHKQDPGQGRPIVDTRPSAFRRSTMGREFELLQPTNCLRGEGLGSLHQSVREHGGHLAAELRLDASAIDPKQTVILRHLDR